MQYDDDVDVIVPTSVAVEQTKTSTSITNLHPAIGVAGNMLRKVNWKNVVVLGGFLGSAFVYFGQWQKPAPPQVQENPLDVRNIPAYSEAPLMSQSLAAISENDVNLMALLNEERQREEVAIAQSFVALATTFTQIPGHKCNGKTVLDCLNTFDVNRIAELDQLATGSNASKKLSTANTIDPIVVKSAARAKVSGLILAKILMTPPASRRPSQQQVVDLVYPVLNSGTPVVQLQPRPATVAKQLKLTQQLEAELSSQSPEKQNAAEICLQLPEEQRLKVKGCN